MNVHMVEIIFQKLHFVFLCLHPQLFVYYTAMPAKNPNHTPHPPMSSQKCIWCKQPKPLERFRINTGGVTRACEPCLEVDNAHAHANMLDNLMFEVDALTHSHTLTYRRHGDCDTLSHQIFGPCSSVLGHWNALYA